MARTRAKHGPTARIERELSQKRVHRPGPKPSLTLDQIAKAAIHLADAEGLQAVSMERVARQVGVTPMALYRYLASKQSLLELMIENVGIDGPDLKIAKGWREKLTSWMRALRELYLDHPWLLAATLGAREMGPNELRWLDSALGILAEAGVPASHRHDIFLVLIGHARSSAEFESAKSEEGPRWNSATLLRDYREKLPALADELETGTFPSQGNRGFEMGLNCVLGGIEALARKEKRGRRVRR